MYSHLEGMEPVPEINWMYDYLSRKNLDWSGNFLQGFILGHPVRPAPSWGLADPHHFHFPGRVQQLLSHLPVCHPYDPQAVCSVAAAEGLVNLSMCLVTLMNSMS
jgi:hypothetical protein